MEYKTPKGIAGPWTSLTEPDRKFDPAFKVSLIFDPADAGVQDFIDTVEAACDSSVQKQLDIIDKKLETATGAKLNSLKSKRENIKRQSPVKNEVADDGSPTGNVIVAFKRIAEGTYEDGKRWKAKLNFFDRKKDTFTPQEDIYQGSTLRLGVDVREYYSEGANMAGATLKIMSVQVIDMVTGGANEGNSNGFDVEEGGYEASEVERAVSKVEVDNADF